MDVVTARPNITTQDHPSSSLEWFVTIKNPFRLWTENWVALVFELALILLFARTWKHAQKRGLRASCFLLSCVFSPLGMELIQVFKNQPGYQNWWYHQGMINVMQGRVPAYVLLSVGLLYYYVDWVNSKMNLPLMAQTLVNALSCSLLALPFQALAPNLQMVMMHFDDPMFAERIFNVSYLQITATFLLFFHMGHFFNTNFDYVARTDKRLSKHVGDCLVSGFHCGVYTIVEVYLLYMLVKLLFTQNTVFCIALAIFIASWLVKNELKAQGIRSLNFTGLSETLFTKRFLFFGMLLMLASSLPMVIKPENLKSNGQHMELGPCDVFHNVTNSSPIQVLRRQYICKDDGPEFGFDFHCVEPSKLSSTNIPTSHYVLCGVPFHDTLVKNLMWYSAAAMAVLFLLLSRKPSESINTETQNGNTVVH